MNYSKWCYRWGYPTRESKDLTRSWRVGLSDTEHVRRTARFAVQCDVAMTWQFATSGYAKVRLQLSGLRYTSSVWPWPGTPKVRICTLQRFGLRQLDLLYTSEKNNETTCSAPWATVIRGCLTLSSSPAFWTLLAPSKKNKVNNAKAQSVVVIHLRLQLSDQWMDDVRNVCRILHSPLCKMICAIGNV